MVVSWTTTSSTDATGTSWGDTVGGAGGVQEGSASGEGVGDLAGWRWGGTVASGLAAEVVPALWVAVAGIIACVGDGDGLVATAHPKRAGRRQTTSKAIA